MLGFGPISRSAISARADVGVTVLPLSALISSMSLGTGSVSLPTSILSLIARISAMSIVQPQLTANLPLSALITAMTELTGVPVLSTNKLQASKLNSYAVASPASTRISVSKVVAYAVAMPIPARESASKAVGYAVATPLQGKQSVSKLVAYAAIYPLTPTPPVFPAIPKGFPISVKPVYANVAGGIPSGRDIRRFQQQLPIWEFEMNFEVLRDQTQNITPYPPEANFTDFIQLAQLFVANVGRAGQFLFDAWWDDSRLGQAIAVGDGSSGNFTVVRTWGYGNLKFTEPVGAVNTFHTVNVYFNGVLQNPSTYFIQKNNILTFTVAPPSGVIITMDFWFYYLCQWATDDQMFVEFFKNIWNSKIKFRSVIQGGGEGGQAGGQFIQPSPNPQPDAAPAPSSFLGGAIIQWDFPANPTGSLNGISGYFLSPPLVSQNDFYITMNTSLLQGCSWKAAFSGTWTANGVTGSGTVRFALFGNTGVGWTPLAYTSTFNINPGDQTFAWDISASGSLPANSVGQNLSGWVETLTGSFTALDNHWSYNVAGTEVSS